MDQVNDDQRAERELVERITAYLASGGLFNPELANHTNVRNLLMDCRDVLACAAQKHQHTDAYFALGRECDYNDFSSEPPSESIRRRIVTLEARLARVTEALTAMVDAEWMMSHDWGGDRAAVLEQAQSALSSTQEPPHG